MKFFDFFFCRCDRILWYGRGLNQLSYVRGESRFSDHRPVYSTFSAEVEMISRCRIRKNMGCSSSRVEVEELLPYSHGYTDLNFYRWGWTSRIQGARKHDLSSHIVVYYAKFRKLFYLHVIMRDLLSMQGVLRDFNTPNELQKISFKPIGEHL